jgi:hypothetical protein
LLACKAKISAVGSKVPVLSSQDVCSADGDVQRHVFQCKDKLPAFSSFKGYRDLKKRTMPTIGINFLK